MAATLWKCAIFVAVVITGTATAAAVSDRDKLPAYINALIMSLQNDSPWMGYEQQVKVLPPPTAGIVRIAVLPVGQGDCTIIQCPKGNIIILDCGSSSSSQGIDASGVFAYLGAQINNVKTIVISHGHYDHYGYLPYIIPTPATSGVQNIVYGGSINDYAEIGNWLKQFPIGTVQAVAGENQCYGASCTTPNGLDFCADTTVKFDILGANYGTKMNEKSIVLKLQHKRWSMIFPGDLEGAAETNLVKHYAGTHILLSDYYKLAHHGAGTLANRKGILSAVNPYVAIASNAYNYQRLKHPRCNVIDTLVNEVPYRRLKVVTPHRLDCGTSTGMTINMNFEYAVYATAPYPGYDNYIEIESDGTPG